jgi:UDPglucose 6-dehydrogenase
MREAPAVVLLHALIGSGAKVKVYDPVAMETARCELPKAWFETGCVELAKHQYHALEDVDALVLVTEWKPFRQPDFKAMKNMMKGKVIFDGRNQYDPEILKADGFEYYGIGRS